MAVAAARMVTMTVGDHGAVDRAPGVYVEVAGWAVQAFGAGDDEVHGFCALVWGYQLGTVGVGRSSDGVRADKCLTGDFQRP